MIVVIDWSALLSACITASVVGAVTGVTQWMLNRHLLKNIERLEDKYKGKANGKP